MHIKTRFKNLLIWISFLFCITTNAQNANEIYKYANNCFSQKNYELAVKNYSRLLFFEQEKYGTLCYENIAVSLFKTENYNEAINYFDLTYNTSKVDSVKYNALLNKSLSYFILKNYDYALLEIYNLPDSLELKYTYRKKILEASIYFMKEDYIKSSAIFKELFSNNKNFAQEFDKMFQKFLKANKLCVNRAKTLSYIIPGLGQAYASDIKNSINSFLLTVGFVTLYLTVANTVSPIEAIVGIGPWFQRYYQGGVKHAGLIAMKKKEKIKSEYYNQILKLVETYSIK